MLLLLQPWRNLDDLKYTWETFESSFDRFMMTTETKIQMILNNIQHYHKCLNAAAEKRVRKRTADNSDSVSLDFNTNLVDENRNEDQIYFDYIDNLLITEESIKEVRKCRETDRDRQYGEKAIKIPYKAGIFQETLYSDNVPNIVRCANEQDQDKFFRWDKELKMVTRCQLQTHGTINLSSIHENLPDVHHKTNLNTSICKVQSAPNNIQHPLLAKLNEEQRRAHDIIEKYLKKELTGKFNCFSLS